jgi:hypothetical protein
VETFQPLQAFPETTSNFSNGFQRPLISRLDSSWFCWHRAGALEVMSNFKLIFIWLRYEWIIPELLTTHPVCNHLSLTENGPGIVAFFNNHCQHKAASDRPSIFITEQWYYYGGNRFRGMCLLCYRVGLDIPNPSQECQARTINHGKGKAGFRVYVRRKKVWGIQIGDSREVRTETRGTQGTWRG